MKQLFITITIFLISCTYIYAQQATVSGKLVDEDGAPLPYAAVSLFSSADSSLAAGGATDDAGAFTLEARPGNYYLQASFLSFQTKTIPGIELTRQGVDLGNVIMASGEVSLDEVVVQTEKSQMSLQLDKRVFQVGQDLSSKGGSATEILENVPSVGVDVDGNVSLRGSENVRILIDGKPSGLVGTGSTDALRQLQGSMIESIEIITNPSARYDAEGEVGIINIVLKKDKARGVNGSFDVSTGYPHNHSAAFNLNFRKKWFNFFASDGISFRQRPGSGFSKQWFTGPDTSYYYERLRDHTRGGWSNNLRLGTDIFLNDFNTLTFAGFYNYSKDNNEAKLTYKDYNEAGELVRTVTRMDEEEETEHDIETALNYRKTFKQKDRLLTADLQWIQSEDTELADITETNSFGTGPLYQRSSNAEDEINWLVQSDYVHPFAEKGKIEGGIKATFRTINNDFSVEEQAGDGTWFLLDDFTNHFIYKENIYAAYVMAANKTGKFSYQGGLRAEYSDISTELTEENQVNDRNYIDFFPSAHLSYEMNESNTLQLSYSRRLSRPRFRHLLPFYSYSDDRNFFSGNPNLEPEYTHSTELGYLKYWEKGSLLSSVYYRYRTGVIERITILDDEGITRIFPINLSTQNAYGVEFNINHDLFTWWRVNANFNFYRAITEGQYQDENLDSDTYGWMTGASSKITLFKKLDFQQSFRYRSPRETSQGRSKAVYSIDAGLAMDVLRGNGTFTLTARDLFNTRRWRSITEGEGFRSESEFQWRSRQVTLSFTYRLNQNKKRAGNGGDGDFNGGGDDMGF